MYAVFATCDRHRALQYLQSVYPSASITDTPDCAGPLLDVIEQDIVRLQDPMMYGNRISVVAGTHWDEGRRAEIAAIAAEFHRRVTGEDA